METSYEIVYAVENYFRSLYPGWDNSEDYNPDEDRFELISVSAQAVGWAIESYELRLRWNEVYCTEILPEGANDDSRILAEDHEHEQKPRSLIEQFVPTQTTSSFIVHGMFEPRCRQVKWYGSDPK